MASLGRWLLMASLYVSCCAGFAVGVAGADEPAADPDAALIAAVQAGDEAEITRQLIGGADPQASDGEGTSVVAMAAGRGDAAAVELLLDGGADADATATGPTPLALAARGGHGGAIEALVLGGARVDAADEQGRTALMQAAAAGHEEAAAALLRLGADRSLRDAQGRTASELAAAAGHAGAAKLAAEPATPAAPAGPVVRPAPGADLMALTLGSPDGQVIELGAGQYRGPIAAKKISLTIRAVGDGEVVIQGDASKAQAVVLALGGRLVLEGVSLSYDGKEQVGVLASQGSRVTLRDCRFDAPPSYAAYAQDKDTHLTVEGCTFTNLTQPGVVALSGASATVSGSTFEKCAAVGATMQGGGALIVRDSVLRDMAGNGITSIKSASLTVDTVTVERCAKVAVIAQEPGEAAVSNSTFSGCRRAVDVQSGRGLVLVRKNRVSEPTADGDGIRVATAGRALVADNVVEGGEVGIMLAGEASGALVAARNDVTGARAQGIQVTAQWAQGGHGVRLVGNRVSGGTRTALLVGDKAQVVGVSNRWVAAGPDSMGISVQSGSWGVFRGDVAVGSARSVNFYESDPWRTRLRRMVVVGRVETSLGAPAMDEASQRVLAVLEADGSAAARLRLAAAGGNGGAEPVKWASVDAAAAALRARGASLAAATVTIEDDLGQREAMGFEVFESPSAAMGRVDVTAADLRYVSPWLDSLRAAGPDATAAVREALKERQRLGAAWPKSAASSQIGELSSLIKVEMAQVMSKLIAGPLLVAPEEWADLGLEGTALVAYAGLDAKARESDRGQLLRAKVNWRLLELASAGALMRHEPLATVSRGETSYVPAGSVWVLPDGHPGLIEPVTLSEGQRREVVLKSPGSVWVRLWAGQDREPTKMLVRMRSPAQMRATLAALRDPARAPEVDVGPVFDATAPVREAARQRALAELAGLAATFNSDEAQGQTAAYYRDLNAREDHARRILAVVGEAEDLEPIVAAASSMGDQAKSRWARVIARIEARLGTLENGRLMALLAGDDPQWREGAAAALDRMGVSAGHDVLRAWVREQPDVPWRLHDAIFALLDDQSPATREAMRVAWDALAAKQERVTAIDAGALAGVYLLVCGNDEDRRAVTQADVEPLMIKYLAQLVEDPMPLVEHLVQIGGIDAARLLTVGFHERGETFAKLLGDLTIQAIATRAAQRAKLGSGAVYQTSVNTSAMAMAFHRPTSRAVEFFGSFGNVIPPVPSDEPGEDLLGRMSWYPETRLVDGYVSAWAKGRRRYETQLEQIEVDEIEEAVKRLAPQTLPPGYEMYLVARSVSTRAFRHHFDFLPPAGGRRWAYTLRHDEHDAKGNKEYGGGVSGVAVVRPMQVGRTVRIEVTLDQKTLYHDIGTLAGMIDRDGDKTEWEHHRYVIDSGRRLIDTVWLRRGDAVIEAREVKRDAGGRFVFEAELPAEDAAGWYAGVTMRWFDQTMLFVSPLFDGEAGRRRRSAREEAATLAAVAQRRPDDVEVRIAQARALEAAGDATGMWAAWQAALAQQPQRVDLWLGASESFAKLGMEDQAAGVLLESVNQNPANVDLWLALIDGLMASGNVSVAADAAGKAAQLSDDPALAATRAMCLFLAGQDAEAATAIQALPEQARSLPLRVAWYVASGAGDAARTSLKAWGDEHRDDPAHDAVASMLAGGSALQAAPSDMWDSQRLCLTHCLIGYRLLLDGKTPEAAERLRQAVATQLRDAPPWRLARAGLRRIEQASKAAKEAQP